MSNDEGSPGTAGPRQVGGEPPAPSPSAAAAAGILRAFEPALTALPRMNWHDLGGLLGQHHGQVLTSISHELAESVSRMSRVTLAPTFLEDFVRQWSSATLSSVLQATTVDFARHFLIDPGLLDTLAQAAVPRFDQAAWDNLARALQGLHPGVLSPNLAGMPGLTAADLERLADEGLTLWAVPRVSIATQLVNAATPRARRRVLGDQWELILDDCAMVAAKSSGGPYAGEARRLEDAIRAIRGGHPAAGQALVATVLDGTRQKFTGRHALSGRLTNPRHARVMDHFAELEIADAMVWRPIFHAYRPTHTPAERAASPGFSRHATAHTASARQMNRRNAVQGAMLAASLIDFATLRHSHEERIRLAA